MKKIKQIIKNNPIMFWILTMVFIICLGAGTGTYIINQNLLLNGNFSMNNGGIITNAIPGFGTNYDIPGGSFDRKTFGGYELNWNASSGNFTVGTEGGNSIVNAGLFEGSTFDDIGNAVTVGNKTGSKLTLISTDTIISNANTVGTFTNLTTLTWSNNFLLIPTVSTNWTNGLAGFSSRQGWVTLDCLFSNSTASSGSMQVIVSNSATMQETNQWADGLEATGLSSVVLPHTFKFQIESNSVLLISLTNASIYYDNIRYQ